MKFSKRIYAAGFKPHPLQISNISKWESQTNVSSCPLTNYANCEQVLFAEMRMGKKWKSLKRELSKYVAS